jgi:ABC-type antimicrobial peptide transport system permease subunit
VYLERVKNFERFNSDTKQRDKLLIQLVFLQSLCLTQIMSFLFGFFGGIGNFIIPHSASSSMTVLDSIEYITLTFVVVFVAGILSMKVTKEEDLLRRILL